MNKTTKYFLGTLILAASYLTVGNESYKARRIEKIPEKTYHQNIILTEQKLQLPKHEKARELSALERTKSKLEQTLQKKE